MKENLPIDTCAHPDIHILQRNDTILAVKSQKRFPYDIVRSYESLDSLDKRERPCHKGCSLFAAIVGFFLSFVSSSNISSRKAQFIREVCIKDPFSRPCPPFSTPVSEGFCAKKSGFITYKTTFLGKEIEKYR